MKMKLVGIMAFVLLSVSILYYGVPDLVFADSHDVLPLSATTELASYGDGDKVKINGKIKNYNSTSQVGQAVTYIVKSPDNAPLSIGQLSPNSDGTFEDIFTAGGNRWKSNGDYIVELKFGSLTGTATVVYTGADAIDTPPAPPPVETPPPTPIETPPDVAPPPPPPPPPDVAPPPPPPAPVTAPEDICGDETHLVDGKCVPKESGGGCLIATAAYGTELAPQVQLLREVRDNTVMSTQAGMTFMSGFNQMYYSFSPTIADWQRENPVFQQTVRAFITPMVSTLSVMTLADNGSELDVLGLGITVIALNLGMYVAAPALIGFKVHKHIKSRK